MTLLFWLLSLLLGWLVGVVINHLGTILPAKESAFQIPYYPDSHQPRPLQAWSGLLAYFTRTHHCPQSGKPLGWRYIIVEIATPLIFLFLLLHLGQSVYLWFVWGYTAILILLTVTDLEHRLIQNVVILPAILLAIVGSFFTPEFTWRLAIFGGAVGFIVFYILAILARGGLGSGDVTLSAFLGLITAFPQIILVLVLGMLLGGVVSAILIVTRRVTMKTFIPYGPFLIVAGWVNLVWGDVLIRYLWPNAF